MKITLVLLAVASGFIVLGLFVGLFTHEWIHDDGYSFGVLMYCNKTNGTSCQDITNVYTGDEDWLLACRYLLIVACGLGGLIFVFSFFATCCVKTSFQSYLRISIVLFFIESGLEAASIAIFLLKVKTTLSSESQEIGYSLIIEFVVLSITGIVLLVLIITALFCEKLCCGDLSVGLAKSELLRFRIPPGDISVSVGKDVFVYAYIENADQVEWYKGKDRVIKYSTDYSENFNKSTGHAQLKVAAARMMYDGEYTCVAKKTVKNEKSEIRKNFFVFVLPVKPVFLQQLKNVKVHLGEEIRLVAMVDQAEMITWYHNQEEILPSRKSKRMKILFRHGTASLIIKNSNYNDGGEYVCCARSGGSPQNQKEALASCEVEVHTELPPSFEDVPSYVSVPTDGTIELTVKVGGFPKPEEVSWFKDDEELQMSRTIHMQYAGGIARLQIYESSDADLGIYECYAKNKHGNNVCRISVQRKPVVECPVCMHHKADVTLECGHVFCKECIQKVKGKLCPKCRKVFREPSRIYL